MIRLVFLFLLFWSIDALSQKDWQAGFGLTHNIQSDSIWHKPVAFYLNQKECDRRAKDFYYGKFSPSDDEATAVLLRLVLTDNIDLRPFYRWILAMTISIQDGALAELTGLPARAYAEKYPEECLLFFAADATENTQMNWADSIGYSGFYDSDDFNDTGKIQTRMREVMLQNCGNCTAGQVAEIREFVRNCFPD